MPIMMSLIIFRFPTGMSQFGLNSVGVNCPLSATKLVDCETGTVDGCSSSDQVAISCNQGKPNL